VVFIQGRLRDLAERSVRHGTQLPEEFRWLERVWFALGWPAFIAMAALIWLMIPRPA
jgi:uncharacterized membrane protein